MSSRNLFLLMLVVAACLSATTVTAGVNRFYIDDIYLTDAGTRITIPIKASFQTPVSTWDVKLVFPEGLTPTRLVAGNDMVFTYTDYEGTQKSMSASYLTNSDYTHAIGTTFGNSVNYEEPYPVQQLKWGTGNYDEMMLLTVDVADFFSGGDIMIISETSCGYDNDPAGLTPDTLFINGNDLDYFLRGDANHDGQIDISDVTQIIDYITYGPANPEYDYYLQTSCDINDDGLVDVRDIVGLIDFLIHDNYNYGNYYIWYTGYELDTSTTTTSVFLDQPYFTQFFIDEMYILQEQLGQDITIPVKASLGGKISSWDVEFEFPEGLTPVNFTPGNGMKLTNYDSRGQEHNFTASSSHNDNFTHFIASTLTDNYAPTDDGGYIMTGTVKWQPGLYEEMFLLTVHVDEAFMGGEIQILTNASCGKDLNNDYIHFHPVTMEYPNPDAGYYPGDVNGDGSIDISDVMCYMYYFADSTNTDTWFSTLSADVHKDGEINLIDMDKLIDYLLWDEWYEGYMLCSDGATSMILVESPPAIPGDLNGDMILDVDDITTIINILLNEDEVPINSDITGDGTTDIDDVTELINRVLSN